MYTEELYNIYIGWVKKAIRKFNNSNCEYDDIRYYVRECYSEVIVSFLEEIRGKKDLAKYFNKYKCILDNQSDKRKIEELRNLMWQMRTRLEEEIREQYDDDIDNNYEDWENL